MYWRKFSTHEFAIGGRHAAEIVRPGRIDSGVDDHAPDVARTRLLGIGRKPDEGIDFAGLEQVDLVDVRIGDPGDVLGGIEADIGGHGTHQQIIGGEANWSGHGYPLAPQIRDGLYAVVGTQFEASHMDAGERGQGPASIHKGQEIDRGLHAEIDVAIRQHRYAGRRHIPNLGKSFLVKELLG